MEIDPEVAISRILHRSVADRWCRFDPAIDADIPISFWNRLEKTLRSNSYLMHCHEARFAIIPSKALGNGKSLFDEEELKSLILSGKIRETNVLELDYNGCLVSILPNYEIENATDALRYAQSTDLVVFFIASTEVSYFLGNKDFETIPNITSNSRKAVLRKASWSTRQYEIAIKQHYEEDLKVQKFTIYWQKKAERVLLRSPEKHFRGSLARFLSQNISDGVVDQEPMNNNSSDRNDIRIIELNSGLKLILEIKWLGICDGQTVIYSDDKANEGVAQLCTYLQNEPSAFAGTVVIYDARFENMPIEWEDRANWHALVKPEPMRFFLDHESASTRAKRKVKERKKARKR